MNVFVHTLQLILITNLIIQIHAFCSAYCSANQCSPSDSDACTACTSPFQYNHLQHPFCQLNTNLNYATKDTISSGVTLNYPNQPLSLSCNSSSGIVGWLNDDDIVSFEVLKIPEPHFKIMLVCWISVSGEWQGSESI